MSSGFCCLLAALTTQACDAFPEPAAPYPSTIYGGPAVLRRVLLDEIEFGPTIGCRILDRATTTVTPLISPSASRACFDGDGLLAAAATPGPPRSEEQLEPAST